VTAVDSHLEIDLTFGQLEQRDSARADEWLASLAMYGEPSAPRFAAIWLPAPREVRPRTFSLMAVNAAPPSPPPFVDAGIFPTHVGLTGSRSELGFRACVVYERFDGLSDVSVHFGAELGKGDLVLDDFALRHVRGLDACVYTVLDTQRVGPYVFHARLPKRAYAAVLHRPLTIGTRRPRSSLFAARSVTASDAFDGLALAPEHRAVLNGYMRGHKAVPDPLPSRGARTLTVQYQDDTLTPWPADLTADMAESFRGSTPIWGPLPRFNLETAYAWLKWKEGDVWPIAIGANGSGEGARFCVTFAPRGLFEPLHRHFVVVNGLDEAPARISQPISDAFAVGSAVSSDALPDLPTQPGSILSGSWPTAAAPPGAAPGISLLSRVVARKGEKASGASSPSVGLPAAAGGLAGHLESVREQLDGLDGAIRDSLHNEAARCAVLCIGRNGRLVLARAYTLAEVGHPITTPRHRFRWASVAKLLQAMRAVHGADAEAWLSSPVLDAYQLSQAERAALQADASPDAFGWFSSLTVRDLFNFGAGWARDRGLGEGDLEHDRVHYQTQVFKLTGRELPLGAGRFRNYLLGSKLRFQNRAPAERYRYNNAAYWAASEMLSLRINATQPDRYGPSMRQWWELSGSLGEGIATPSSRNACLFVGEVICRHPPGWARASSVRTSELVESLGTLGELPAVTPAAYYGGRDLEMEVGSGLLTMSGPAMVRILQGMHPNPPPPVKPLLSLDEVDRLTTVSTTTGAALGCDAETTTFADHDALHIKKLGGDPGCTSRADHYLWFDGEPQSLSMAWSVNLKGAGLPAVTLLDRIAELEKLSFWTTQPNLFPGFFPHAMP
jgi:hypothetical protein